MANSLTEGISNDFCSHISSEISLSEVTIDVLTAKWNGLPGAFCNDDHLLFRTLSVNNAPPPS